VTTARLRLVLRLDQPRRDNSKKREALTAVDRWQTPGRRTPAEPEGLHVRRFRDPVELDRPLDRVRPERKRAALVRRPDQHHVGELVIVKRRLGASGGNATDVSATIAPVGTWVVDTTAIVRSGSAARRWAGSVATSASQPR
jgi:hypothetical protein